MIIETSDKKRAVDIGKDEIWHSLYSTVIVRLKNNTNLFPCGVKFLETAFCKAEEAEITARQINMIRDSLSQFPPSEAIYDYNNPGLKAPWANAISPVITSCANLYTTADGRDLLFEIVSILCYASVKGVDVQPL